MVEPYKNISQHPHPNELRQMAKVVQATELIMESNDWRDEGEKLKREHAEMREIARGLLKAIGRVEKAFEELRNTWNGESYVVRESYMVNLGRDLQVVN
jgi:hypothetical protein